MYHYGGDLLHALNIALGQAINLSHKHTSDLSPEEQFQNRLSETCKALNAKFQANFKKLINRDAESPFTKIFIEDLDPDIWKVVYILKEPISNAVKKGTDTSNGFEGFILSSCSYYQQGVFIPCAHTTS